MIDRTAGWLARCAGATLLVGDPQTPGPRRAVVDSREVGPGDLFVGLVGQSADGGEFAADALAAGAWGALVGPRRARELGNRGLVIEAHNTLVALQRLARAWRRELACPVVGVTGSTGKTSTKDILARAPRASPHHPRQPPELEHRDRAAAVDAGGRARHRGAGARDGDAR